MTSLKMNIAWTLIAASCLALGSACDGAPGVDDESTEDVVEASDAFCLVNLTAPPAYDHSESLIGSNDYVGYEDVLDGSECDMRVARALTNPSTDRVRYVHVVTYVPGYCSEYSPGFYIWKSDLTGWTGSYVPVTKTNHYDGVLRRCSIEKTVDLGASNNYYAVVAGFSLANEESSVLIEIYE